MNMSVCVYIIIYTYANYVCTAFPDLTCILASPPRKQYLKPLRRALRVGAANLRGHAAWRGAFATRGAWTVREYVAAEDGEVDAGVIFSLAEIAKDSPALGDGGNLNAWKLGFGCVLHVQCSPTFFQYMSCWFLGSQRRYRAAKEVGRVLLRYSIGLWKKTGGRETCCPQLFKRSNPMR